MERLISYSNRRNLSNNLPVPIYISYQYIDWKSRSKFNKCIYNFYFNIVFFCVIWRGLSCLATKHIYILLWFLVHTKVPFLKLWRFEIVMEHTIWERKRRYTLTEKRLTRSRTLKIVTHFEISWEQRPILNYIKWAKIIKTNKSCQFYVCTSHKYFCQSKRPSLFVYSKIERERERV